MGIFSSLSRWLGGGSPGAPDAPRPPAASSSQPEDPIARIGAIRAARAAELETTAEQRMRACSILRDRLQAEAHDYVDLVMAHPRRDQVSELQVTVALEAYLCGVMARHGWISEMDAQQMAFVLGRKFRQQLAALGVDVTKVKLTIGSVIDNSLREMAALGFAGS